MHPGDMTDTRRPASKRIQATLSSTSSVSRRFESGLGKGAGEVKYPRVDTKVRLERCLPVEIPLPSMVLELSEHLLAQDPAIRDFAVCLDVLDRSHTWNDC